MRRNRGGRALWNVGKRPPHKRRQGSAPQAGAKRRDGQRTDQQDPTRLQKGKLDGKPMRAVRHRRCRRAPVPLTRWQPTRKAAHHRGDVAERPELGFRCETRLRHPAPELASRATGKGHARGMLRGSRSLPDQQQRRRRGPCEDRTRDGDQPVRSAARAGPTSRGERSERSERSEGRAARARTDRRHPGNLPWRDRSPEDRASMRRSRHAGQ